MGQQLNMGSKDKTLAKATGLLIRKKINNFYLIYKIMLDKLLILDPKLGDLTMSRFVDSCAKIKLKIKRGHYPGIERVNVA
jgi:hypothetical protein